MSDFEERCGSTAEFLVQRLSPFADDLLYLQDGFTGYRLIPTLILYLVMNLAFYGIYQWHLSVYSLFALICALLVIPGDVHLFLFHSFCGRFRRPESSSSIRTQGNSLAIDVLCSRLAVLYHYVMEIISGLSPASFHSVGHTTIILAGVFYIGVKIGDAAFSWVLLELIFFFPSVVTRRFGFELIGYPMETEQMVLGVVRSRLSRRNDAQ
jgi:hypothetical protein